MKTQEMQASNNLSMSLLLKLIICADSLSPPVLRRSTFLYIMACTAPVTLAAGGSKGDISVVVWVTYWLASVFCVSNCVYYLFDAFGFDGTTDSAVFECRMDV